MKRKCSYQYVVLEIDQRKTVVTRDQLMEILHAENVLARRYFYPGCHRRESYSSSYPDAHLARPQRERVAASAITLPTGQAITPETIRVVCDIIRTAVRNADEICKLFKGKPPA